MTISMFKSAIFIAASLIMSVGSSIQLFFSILMGIAGFIWFGNQIKHNVIDKKYNGDWLKWLKNWLGFKSK